VEKKLLFVLMIFSNSIIYSEGDLQGQAEESSLEKKEQDEWKNAKAVLKRNFFIEKQLNEDKAKKDQAFKEELAQSLLANNPEAIKTLVQNNEKEYKQEAEDEKKKQDDTHIGWSPKHATPQSLTGHVRSNIERREAGKAKINKEFEEAFSGYEKDFKTEIMQILKNELKKRSLFMERTIPDGLDICRPEDGNYAQFSEKNYAKCLCAQGVSWFDIIQDDYFDNYISETFTRVIKAVEAKGIPLSKDTIIKICQNQVLAEGSREFSITNLNASKQKAQTQVRDILNNFKNKNETNEDRTNEDSSSV
jgi:hypothetical protein